MSNLYINFFNQGLFTGLVVAVPIGPISILCMQRSIRRGFVAGLVSGLGASTGDTVYAFMGAFGLSSVATALVGQKAWFSLVSGLLLYFLGVKTWFGRTDSYNSSLSTPNFSIKLANSKNALLKDYLTTLILDLVNPMTILPFVAVFGGLYDESIYSNSWLSSFFVLGVFVSGMLWRILLSSSANWLREGFKPSQIQWINRITGTAMAVFGCTSIYSVGI